MAQLPVRQPDWIPTAPIVVQRSHRMPASADVVWARIADHESWPEWFTTIKRVRVTGDATGVGGRREVSVPGATFGEVFTAWTPGEQFAFAVVSAPRLLASLAESLVISDADGASCTLTYTQGYEPARGFGWFWRIVTKRVSGDLDATLGRLAELVRA